MAQKLFNFPESTSRTQTHVITITGLKSVSSVSVNTGTATVTKTEGDKVTIQVQNGAYSRRVQTGGSYTPADSKTVKVNRNTTQDYYRIYDSGGSYTTVNETTGTDPYYYNSGGYSGYLYKGKEVSREYTGYTPPTNPTPGVKYKVTHYDFVHEFSGTVDRPESDTRTYTNYYQYDVTVDYIVNSSPTISGVDTNLGDKNGGFIVTYSVNDPDLGDSLTVKEKINGVTKKTVNNAPRNEIFTIEITEEMLYSFDLYTTNTIEIEVSDGQGNVAYRRYTFKRTNTAPKISGEDENLGSKTEGFDITFSATDQENDSMSAKVYVNDRVAKAYEIIEPNQEYTYSLGKLDFVQLNNIDVHKIRIEVQDHNSATSIRNYTFTREINRIMYSLSKETDTMATQILISPTWHIAEGAIGQVLVCNNVFDEEPIWEDATEQILLERHFNFTNTAKVADTWGIGVQIIINKGTATELSYLAGFGGAYK